MGIDFTKSNEWTGLFISLCYKLFSFHRKCFKISNSIPCKSGSRSFKRKSLHHIGNGQNPYEQAISIIGRTLSVFDEDNLIPCFGFGDGTNSMRTNRISLYSLGVFLLVNNNMFIFHIHFSINTWSRCLQLLSKWEIL